MSNQTCDWHPADIKAALIKKGWTVTGLSKASGMARTTLSNVFMRPYPRAERIVAKALDLEPSQIWPSRYQDKVNGEVA